MQFNSNKDSSEFGAINEEEEKFVETFCDDTASLPTGMDNNKMIDNSSIDFTQAGRDPTHEEKNFDT